MLKNFKILTLGYPQRWVDNFYSHGSNWMSLICGAMATQGGLESVGNEGRSQKESSKWHVEKFQDFDFGVPTKMSW